MKPESPRALIAIDLLRFACAVLVLVYHFGAAFWLSPSPHGQVLLGAYGGTFHGTMPTRIGWIGVELFFVISGLVIAKSAVGIGWTGFLWKRTLRLAPAAWICATLSAVLLAASGPFDSALVEEYWRSIRFWPVGTQIDGSYWTLGVECAFYLLVALMIGRGAGARRMEALGFALGWVSTAFWAWAIWSGPSAAAWSINRTVTLALLPHGCFFAIGMMIAAFGDRRITLARCVALVAFSGTALVEIARHGATLATLMRMECAIWLAQVLFVGGIAILLGANRLQSVLARWIAPDVARTIGLMTYPLYLLHQDAGAAVLADFVAAGVPIRLAAGLAAGVILSLAWIIATTFEPALRGGLVRVLRPHRALAPDTLRSASPPIG